ncbi:unnamed protein product [Lampetra planeri]
MRARAASRKYDDDVLVFTSIIGSSSIIISSSIISSNNSIIISNSRIIISSTIIISSSISIMGSIVINGSSIITSSNGRASSDDGDDDLCRPAASLTIPSRLEASPRRRRARCPHRAATTRSGAKATELAGEEK